MFARNVSMDLVGIGPNTVSIDGGVLSLHSNFDYNRESNLDLEYAMNLITKEQNITLYQAGDIIEGASFNSFLEVLDGEYCTFDGGDDPPEDGVYPDKNPSGYDGQDRDTIMDLAYVMSTSYGFDEARIAAPLCGALVQ